MRIYKNAILLASLIIIVISCKKQANSTIEGVTAINIVHAVADLPALKVRTSEKTVWRLNTTQLNFNGNVFGFSKPNLGTLQIVESLDTTKLKLSKALKLKPSMYSMFLCGTALAIDTVFREERDFPYVPNYPGVKLDSVTYVRFVNLSPNSPALKINISGVAANEVENLTYKSIGDWKPYASKALATTNYVFQVRNALTDAVLLTYTFGATSTNRFKSVSLIIKGEVGGNGTKAFGIFPVNYFY